jgi:hypothetical protein
LADENPAAQTDSRNEAAPAASEVIVNSGPEKRPTPTTEILRAEAGNIHADSVSMERSGAEQVTAERVIMNNSGARTVDARSAQIDRSGILALRSEKAVLYNSTAIAVATTEARIVRAPVFLLKADSVTFEGDAKIAILAGPACGDVRPIVDAQGAAMFGACAGVVVVLLGKLLGRLARRG